ncbi:hypothetical protein RSAG8_12122, partial [Rhizoctonia solani AG-8 WAC10335]
MHNGMDAYFFVRFLRMMARLFLPIWLVSWAVLLPVDAAGINNKDGLDQFTFGNIPGNSQLRYVAHLILAWFGTFWVLFNIKKEMKNFVEQEAAPFANTVLITGVPRKFLDEEALVQLFQHVPGGVKKVWLNRDLKELPDIYTRRTAASNKLESAEFKLVATAQKLHHKHTLALAKAAKKGQDITTVKPPVPDADVESAAVADRYVPRSERPMHRLPPFKWLPFGLPFMGEKVDTIEWARKEVVESDQLLNEGRRKLADDRANIGVDMNENYPPLNSAFILFNQQIGAHIAAQILVHNQPYRMAEKYTEVAPADVIWGNLGINPYEARIRKAISYAATAALIIFWAIPVSFVGVVSNVAQLCVKYKWMQWLCNLPDPVVGIISGILPPVALAVLMMLLPIILRLLARFEGIPRFTGLELSLMTRYFVFQVVHSFLIVTISSGIIAALPQLASNPTSIPTILAQKLPEASTFFLTYAILQGLAGSAGGLLQIVPLVLYYVKLYILGSTPRSIYNIKYSLRNVAWGTLFPSMTLITVIGLAYSIISPIINGLIFVAFFLFYQVWKYLFLWQFGQPEAGDTGGHAAHLCRFVYRANLPVCDKLEREHAEHEMHARTAPPKAETYGKNVAEEGKHNEGPEDFTHPAAIEPQRVVWLPKDLLGVAEAEEKELKQQGIEVSTEHAVMDEKGHVELTGPPPGGDDDALFG